MFHWASLKVDSWVTYIPFNIFKHAHMIAEIWYCLSVCIYLPAIWDYHYERKKNDKKKQEAFRERRHLHVCDLWPYVISCRSLYWTLILGIMSMRELRYKMGKLTENFEKKKMGITSLWPWLLTQGHQFQQDLSQCGKQPFSENRVQIDSFVRLEFCSQVESDTQTDRQTHRQTAVKI